MIEMFNELPDIYKPVVCAVAAFVVLCIMGAIGSIGNGPK